MTSPESKGEGNPPPSSSPHRATVVGIGLIGGSIGLALRDRGWFVSGVDHDPARAQRALELGAIDAIGPDPSSSITFVATPVGAIASTVREALAGGGVVTDVGSVKSSIVRTVEHPRFVGGHPMAGSEQEGVDGATATMFEGAVWVLTPTESTDHEAHALVRSTVKSFGADVVELPPDRHDALVAVVSHVPQLTASSLMVLADERSEEHRAMLRLAAGGFRDIVVNHSHLGEMIESALGDGTRFGVRLRYSHEARALETAGGIVQAMPLLGREPFAVVSGDIHTEFDYGSLVPRLEAIAKDPQGTAAHFVLVDNPPWHPGGDMALEQGRVRREGRKLTYGNISLFHPAVFDGIARGTHFKLFPWAYALVEAGRVTGEHFRGAWDNVGTAEQLADLDRRLSS